MRGCNCLKAGLSGTVAAAAFLLIGMAEAPALGEATLDGKDTNKATPAQQQSAAYQWLDVALEATAREHERNAPRPTVGSRMLAIVVTAMYDAWAAYDARAVGTRLGDKLRRPPAERTAANKAKAIGYALGRILLDMYPEDAAWIT